MIYLMRESDHAFHNVSSHVEEIRAAVSFMNKELLKAVITAIESENPVDGYREAVELIEDTFEDMDAAMIKEMLTSSVLRILRARVEGLMSDSKCRSGSGSFVKERVL